MHNTPGAGSSQTPPRLPRSLCGVPLVLGAQEIGLLLHKLSRTSEPWLFYLAETELMKTAVHIRFPRYVIREDGVVLNRSGEICRGWVHKRGYRQHDLIDAVGQRRKIRTNRLVLEAFAGPPSSSLHAAAHNDGDRLNNSVSNLQWKTQKENEEDKDRHGTRARGETVGTSRLTEGDVVQIRSSRNTAAELAKRFGVSLNTIKRAINGENWKHVTIRSPDPLPG